MTIADLLITLTELGIENPGLAFLTTLIAAVSGFTLGNEIVRSNARVPGMKGPRGLPLVGNLWDIRVNAAEKYRQWAKSHGDVYQIQLG